MVRRNPYDPDSPTWLFNCLRTATPRNTLSGFVKALKVVGGTTKYKDVAVSELPEDASAGGARPGDPLLNLLNLT